MVQAFPEATRYILVNLSDRDPIKIASIMQDFTTGMLRVYCSERSFVWSPVKEIILKTDNRSAEESALSSAISRYRNDTVAFGGAIQVVPVFLQSWVSFSTLSSDSMLRHDSFVHSLIIKKSHALNVLFDRLHRAPKSKQHGRKEVEALKSICSVPK